MAPFIVLADRGDAGFHHLVRDFPASGSADGGYRLGKNLLIERRAFVVALIIDRPVCADSEPAGSLNGIDIGSEE